MKKCETCLYGSEYELDKPCIVYREDCPLYQKVGDGMTRDEAIKVLQGEVWINCQEKWFEALDMAIKALAQEPCEDAISRQAVIDILEKEGHKWGNDYRDWVDAIEEIKKLPSVNPASNISIQITEREKYGRFN